MPPKGSYTTTLASPTAVTGPDSFASHMALSNSVSSLSSSRHQHYHQQPQSSQISKTYKQASTLFLTRRLPEALSTILPVIQSPPQPVVSADDDATAAASEPSPIARVTRSTRIKVWTLYLTVLNAVVELEPDEGKDAFGSQEWRALCSKVRDGEIWEEVVRDGYHGVAGDVDADVVINLATLLLAHARTQTRNQKHLESYLASSTTPNFDLTDRFPSPSRSRSRLGSVSSTSRRRHSPSRRTGGTDTPRDLNSRVKILELYTLHVLPRNDEWDTASEFISVSPVLDDERREAFLQALQSLRDEQLEAEQRDVEARQEAEEKLRRDVEEAKRLRARNEERERKRLEEERSRRSQQEEGGGGSEVDYGVEKTPGIAGSMSGTGTGTGVGIGTGPGSNKSPRPGKAHSSAQGPAASSNPRGSMARNSRKTSAAARPPPTLRARAAMVVSRLAGLIEQLGASFKANPQLLMRLVAFAVGLILVLGQKNVRERLRRLLGDGWNKIKATAGMGTKVSYI